MREAGDIEQDANLVLGVWDEQAAALDSLQQRLATINEKIEDVKYGLKEGVSTKLEIAKTKITQEIESSQKQNNNISKNLKVKVLKNRNGRKDLIADLSSYPSRFLITGMDNNNDHANAAKNNLQNMNIK